MQTTNSLENRFLGCEEKGVAPLVPFDPWSKTVSLFRLANARKWNIVMLSDVVFDTDSVRQFSIDDMDDNSLG